MGSLLVVDRAALKSAARAAIVTTAMFAFADKVIGNQSMALFAAIGSFALLGLTQFTGPAQTRLLAYVALGCVGATFIALGTLCSSSPWLAAARGHVEATANAAIAWPANILTISRASKRFSASARMLSERLPRTVEP